jgi:hypothetical protein
VAPSTDPSPTLTRQYERAALVLPRPFFPSSVFSSSLVARGAPPPSSGPRPSLKHRRSHRNHYSPPPRPPRPGGPRLWARSRRLDPSLTSPVSSFGCRTSSPPSLATGPHHRLGTSMSRHPSSPSSSTHRLGEPPPLPPCQACCRRPYGAHATSPTTPRPSTIPRRPWYNSCAARGDRAGEAPNVPRRSCRPGHYATGPGRRSEAIPQCGQTLCARGLKFSFSFVILEIHINFKNAYKIQYHSEKYETNFYRILKSRSTHRNWPYHIFLSIIVYKIAWSKTLKYFSINIYACSYSKFLHAGSYHS